MVPASGLRVAMRGRAEERKIVGLCARCYFTIGPPLVVFYYGRLHAGRRRPFRSFTSHSVVHDDRVQRVSTYYRSLAGKKKRFTPMRAEATWLTIDFFTYKACRRKLCS